MKSDMKMQQVVILMAEDNPTDVMITQEGLASAKMSNPLFVVEDGVEALDFLRRRGKFADVPRPDLILLDLNMPKKGGMEVLNEIKQDENLKRIPVVILTTSKAEEDIVKAYGLHANCYISKPVDFDAFTKVIKSIQSFWFNVVTLPHEASYG